MSRLQKKGVPRHAGDPCPDPGVHQHGSIYSSSSSMASRDNIFGPDGKLSSASAAASLKYARPQDLPSYPSRGLQDESQDISYNRPSQTSYSAGRAASLAADKGGRLDLWEYKASKQGQSAATLAAGKGIVSPSINFGYGDEEKKRALQAATLSLSRSNKNGSGVKTPRNPLSDTMSNNGLEASRFTHQHALGPEMFTEYPPVPIEVEAQRYQDGIRAAAVSMAKRMYELEHNKTSAKEARGSSVGSQPQIYLGLEETAKKLAAERLAALDPDGIEAYKDHYGFGRQGTQKSTMRQSMRNRSTSQATKVDADGFSDDDEAQAKKVRGKTSILRGQLAELDNKRDTDRQNLMAAAEARVKARLANMDEQVFANTGKVPPGMQRQWEAQARAKLAGAGDADQQQQQRNLTTGKVHIGFGKYMDQTEIDAIASARMQPVLDEISETAAKQRQRDEEIRIAEEERRAADLEEKQRIQNEKDALKLKDFQEKQGRDIYLAQEKAERDRVKAEQDAEKRRLKEIAKNERDRIKLQVYNDKAQEKFERKRIEAEQKAERERIAAEERAERERRRQIEIAERRQREAEEKETARVKAEEDAHRANEEAEIARIHAEKDAEDARIQAEEDAAFATIKAEEDAELVRIQNEKAATIRAAQAEMAEDENERRLKEEEEAGLRAQEAGAKPSTSSVAIPASTTTEAPITTAFTDDAAAEEKTIRPGDAMPPYMKAAEAAALAAIATDSTNGTAEVVGTSATTSRTTTTTPPSGIAAEPTETGEPFTEVSKPTDAELSTDRSVGIDESPTKTPRSLTQTSSAASTPGKTSKRKSFFSRFRRSSKVKDQDRDMQQAISSVPVDGPGIVGTREPVTEEEEEDEEDDSWEPAADATTSTAGPSSSTTAPSTANIDSTVTAETIRNAAHTTHPATSSDEGLYDEIAPTHGTGELTPRASGLPINKGKAPMYAHHDGAEDGRISPLEDDEDDAIERGRSVVSETDDDDFEEARTNLDTASELSVPHTAYARGSGEGNHSPARSASKFQEEL